MDIAGVWQRMNKWPLAIGAQLQGALRAASLKRVDDSDGGIRDYWREMNIWWMALAAATPALSLISLIEKLLHIGIAPHAASTAQFL